MNVQFSERLTDLISEKIEVKLNGQSYLVHFQGFIFRRLESGDMETYLERKDFDCFCYNKNNKITCWPLKQGEQPLNEKGKWKLEGRQEMKPGKFLSLLRPFIRITQRGGKPIQEKDNPKLFQAVFLRTCEVFTDKVRGVNTPLSFEISDKPSEIYRMPIHPDAGPYLQSSCMRLDSPYDCRFHSKFYDYVPGLKCLYQEAEGKLLMRALLWTKTQAYNMKGPRVTFLDRIYGTSMLNHRLIEYAKAQGWAWRTFESRTIYWKDECVPQIFQPLGKRAIEYLWRQGAPFIDTLFQLPYSSGYPSLGILFGGEVKGEVEEEEFRTPWVLRDCEGDPFGWYSRCRVCLKRVNINDVKPLGLCEKCTEKYVGECTHCKKPTVKKKGYGGEKIENEWYCSSCARLHRFHHARQLSICTKCEYWMYSQILGERCRECRERINQT